MYNRGTAVAAEATAEAADEADEEVAPGCALADCGGNCADDETTAAAEARGRDALLVAGTGDSMGAAFAAVSAAAAAVDAKGAGDALAVPATPGAVAAVVAPPLPARR